MALASTFGDTVNAGFDTFFRAIPQIVGALVLLVVGWIIAGIIGRLVKKLLDGAGADRLTKRAGIDGFLQRAGVRNASAGLVVGFIVKWWIRLIVLEIAIPALGISAITTTLDKIVAYIPSLFAALIIVLIGAFLAKLAGEGVRGIARGAGFGNAEMLGTVVQTIVLVLVFVAALQQVHVAETLVNELLIAVLVAAALAAGLAFGLGGRDVAARLLQSAYDSGGQATSQLRAARQQQSPTAPGAQPRIQQPAAPQPPGAQRR
ncbi:MAG: hypothetical protein M3010_00795 [Candidatus Dormibacteraeota bacterium]|nr:hypothetical protein [Candidatus Dormibacteraeota bacterium]